MISIRGAITIENDTRDEVISSTKELLNAIINKNNINTDDIVSIIFTCTQDIKSAYPAVGARELGLTNAGLLCFNEMYVVGSLSKCIRVLVLLNSDLSQKYAKHVYLKGAASLRPDIAE